MDGGERAYQEHQRYLLETGQWSTGIEPLGTSQPAPVLPDNPISEGLKRLEDQQSKAKLAFDLERWKDERDIRRIAVYEVSDHTGNYTKAIEDFLQHAPASRMVPVWLYRVPHGKTLLMDRSPADAAEQRYLNTSGLAAQWRLKRRYREVTALMQREAQPELAFTLRCFPFTMDNDTGRYFDNGSTFFILSDGKRWTASGMTLTLTPQRLVERCIAWITGTD